MRRRVGARVAVVVGALVVALGAPVSGAGIHEACAAAATGPSVAVVVDFGDVSGVGTPPGGVETGCVPWSSGFTGRDALQDAGFAVRAQPSGLVCAINGYPADGCGTKTGDRKYQYWAYWKAGAGDDSWTYASTSSATKIHDGVTEGWRFVEGAGSPNDPQPRAAANHDATCGPTTAPDAPSGAAAPGGAAPTQNDSASPSSSAVAPGANPVVPDTAADGIPDASVVDPGVVTSTTAATPGDVALAVATPTSKGSDAGNIVAVVLVVAAIVGLGAAAFFRSRRAESG